MLEVQLRYLPKLTVNRVRGDEYLLLASLDGLRVEGASLEVGEPQLGWSSLVAVGGAQNDFHLQMADALTSFSASVVRSTVHDDHYSLPPYDTILLRE